MLIPATYDFVIYQGADFALEMTVDIDLTGYTVRMQGRESMAAAGTTFSLTGGSGITVTAGATSTIAIAIAGATTAGYTSGLEGVWDLEIVSGGGAIDRLVGGRFTVDPEVTR